jgi:hypothetical protein
MSTVALNNEIMYIECSSRFITYLQTFGDPLLVVKCKCAAFICIAVVNSREWVNSTTLRLFVHRKSSLIKWYYQEK